LLVTEVQATKDESKINSTIITDYLPNTMGYMNLRFYGYNKYMNFGLDKHENIDYYIPVKFISLAPNRKAMNVYDIFFNKKYIVKHQTLKDYFILKQVVNDSSMKFISLEDKSMYPQLIL
jgi:hypothetical protein